MLYTTRSREPIRSTTKLNNMAIGGSENQPDKFEDYRNRKTSRKPIFIIFRSVIVVALQLSCNRIIKIQAWNANNRVKNKVHLCMNFYKKKSYFLFSTTHENHTSRAVNSHNRWMNRESTGLRIYPTYSTRPNQGIPSYFYYSQSVKYESTGSKSKITSAERHPTKPVLFFRYQKVNNHSSSAISWYHQNVKHKSAGLKRNKSPLQEDLVHRDRLLERRQVVPDIDWLRSTTVLLINDRVRYYWLITIDYGSND